MSLRQKTTISGPDSSDKLSWSKFGYLIFDNTCEKFVSMISDIRHHLRRS